MIRDESGTVHQATGYVSLDGPMPLFKRGTGPSRENKSAKREEWAASFIFFVQDTVSGL